MLTERKFSEFLRDLQQIERATPRTEEGLSAQGDLILSAFLRHTAHDRGAVYLRDARNAPLRLVAKSDTFAAPSTLDAPVPDEVVDRFVDGARFSTITAASELDEGAHTLIPIRNSRDHYGVIALGRVETRSLAEGDLEVLRAASRYLSALINSQRMTSEVREGEFQLKYRLWELESLYDIGLSITSTLDLDKLADEILFRTISLLNARRAALFLRRGDNFSLHRSFGDVRCAFLEEELTDEKGRQLMNEGVPIRFDMGANCIFPDCETLLAIPIRTNDQVIGVLAAADRELRDGGVGAFEENDLRVLSLFANQVAIALENARLHQQALEKQAMERELELAATIQRDILPQSCPEVDGFEIDALSRPAKQLGGDYHAFFEREGKLSVVVADVSGKSVPAAILVSALHAALQLLFAEGRDLGEIATELNEHIHHWSSENKFITLFIATIDAKHQAVRYVNAGHNAPYVVTPAGLDTLSSHGLPIGIMSQTVYKTQAKPFPLGSLLVAYSDGITEAENGTDEEFGSGRLEAILTQYATESCAAIKHAISSAVDSFAAGVPQHDDQTMVLVRTLRTLKKKPAEA